MTVTASFLFHFLASTDCTAGGVVTVGGFETLFKDEPKETNQNQHQLPTEKECVTSAMLCVCTQDNLHLTTAEVLLMKLCLHQGCHD